MAKRDLADVDAYIEAQAAAVQPVLRRVRAAIRKAVPRAAESISYHLPTYKIDKLPLIYFAAWKQHYSVYPITALVTETFADELARHDVEKGTVRFPYAEPVPVKLIAAIAQLRAQEITGAAKKP